MVNYYKELGIDVNLKGEDLKEQIKKVQRKWVQRTNAPDQNRRQEAERKVTMIDEAFKILTDEAKRLEYDNLLNNNHTESSTNREEVKVDGYNVQELIDKAWNFINSGNYADAIVLARKATVIDGSNHEAWATLGYADYLWNNIDDAIYEYRKAISLKPNEDSYYCDLGNIYLDINKYAEAEDCAKKAIHLNPNSMYNKSLIATILYEKGRYQDAINIFTDLIKQDPNNNSIKRTLAYSYYQLGLGYCYKEGKYYYCVEKNNIEKMIECMTKARSLHIDPEFDEKINWGKKNLEKKFDKRKWGIFIYPALFILTGEGFSVIFGLILAAAAIYFSIRPNYEITSNQLFNKKSTYDHIATPLHWLSTVALLFCWGIIKGALSMFANSNN